MAETLKISGTVTKCEMRKFDHPDPYRGRYSPCSEYYHLKLMVALEANDGREFWFYSPPVEFVVSCPVGCPIAVHFINDENDWIKDGETVHGKTSSGSYGIPQVEVGDRLEIQGRVKKETRFGTQLFYVKRIRESKK